MPKRRYTKETIIEALQNLAKQLGNSKLSTADISKILGTSTVCYHFGSVGNALEAAGLERTGSGEHFRGKGDVLSDEQLFGSLLDVETKLGREPGYGDYNAHGKYSSQPFRKRFGKWPDVLAHYGKWKVENADRLNEFRSSTADAQMTPAVVEKSAYAPKEARRIPNHKSVPQLYGEQINFRSFRHAPTNEQGVVAMF